jgi:hypothetical protein
VLGVIDDCFACGGHPRCIGERQIPLCREPLGRDDFDLSWLGQPVIFERSLIQVLVHESPSIDCPVKITVNPGTKVRSIVRFRSKEETDLEAAIAVGDAILA